MTISPTHNLQFAGSLAFRLNNAAQKPEIEEKLRTALGKRRGVNIEWDESSHNGSVLSKSSKGDELLIDVLEKTAPDVDYVYTDKNLTHLEAQKILGVVQNVKSTRFTGGSMAFKVPRSGYQRHKHDIHTKLEAFLEASQVSIIYWAEKQFIGFAFTKKKENASDKSIREIPGNKGFAYLYTNTSVHSDTLQALLQEILVIKKRRAETQAG